MGEFDSLTVEQVRLRRPGGADAGPEASPLSLQAAIGNSAVARLLQREMPEEEEVQAKHDSALAQRVGEMPDEEEVQAKHDSALGQRDSSSALAQRDAPAEVGLAGGGLSDGLAGRIDSQRGSGSPLDDGTRSTMEGALGTSLGSVRVHVGSESDSLNQAITAKAFTTGDDVFVRSDQWAPGSSSTQRLMAHELTHVAQQRSGVPGGDGGGMSVGAADTAEEHEADGVAEAVMQRVAQRAGAGGGDVEDGG